MAIVYIISFLLLGWLVFKMLYRWRCVSYFKSPLLGFSQRTILTGCALLWLAFKEALVSFIVSFRRFLFIASILSFLRCYFAFECKGSHAKYKWDRKVASCRCMKNSCNIILGKVLDSLFDQWTDGLDDTMLKGGHNVYLSLSFR